MTVFGLCFDASARGVPTHHDLPLVVLSFLVAAFTSFTALEIAERLRGSSGVARLLWRIAAAVALGGGIWSMHFVAMLAFQIPLRQAYDPLLTTLSGLIAISAVGLGLGVLEKPVTARRLAGAGLLVGLGVTAMHYCGMAALRVPGQIFYRPVPFALSAVIAILAATTALWLAYALRSIGHRVVAAVVMASAICGMHYTGMAATVIVAGPAGGAPTTGLFEARSLAWGVAGSMAVILGLALASALLDRRFERHTLALALVEEARRSAEAADRAKSEFLANISHEIRTPLNGVLGLSSLLATTELTAAQREMVAIIEASARTLNVLLSDVLDLAKIEAGRIELESIPFAPADCVRHVRGLFAPAAAEKGLSFVAEIADDLEVRVLGDPTRLTQILTNLCSNAVKFTRTGGVSFRAWVDRAGGSERHCFEVTDTGVGMSAEATQRLFQRFVQGDGSISRSFGGTGLGLAISRTLARLMGGDVTVRSLLGVGSTFTLTIALPPWTGVEDAAPQGDIADGGSGLSALGRRPRVLLVEDHPVNRRVIELILGDFAVLECAEDGSLGLAAYRAGAFDVVLMDMQMPVMDGLEATQEIRRFERGEGRGRTPIIVLSANALKEHVDMALAAGADFHLAKPVNAPDLLEAVKRALSAATAPPAGRSLSDQHQSASRAHRAPLA
jgi:signal transduction histidine kinase/FixJ family two-component response regulator